jgi:UDP-3-O-[3-hydroxymyristoyl] glucosamine N-acyltransferase
VIAETRTWRLAELAAESGADLQGDGDTEIGGLATLDEAVPGDISFLANERYLHQLTETQASAVILSQDHVERCPTNALVANNPYLCYARIAALLFPEPPPVAGIHPSAVVSASARIDPNAEIGPLCYIGENAEVGPGVVVGPGCVLQKGVRIGERTRLVARVMLGERTRVGRRCLIHPGAVIGSDGFGLADDGGAWVKIPQLGCVRIGDDVEIGANTTIDRGSLRDTVIEDGVKLDNQIQIGHNVHLGAHTAGAACSGISGSTRVGRHCTIGGNTGIAGHLEIGDGVYFTGMSMVTRSFTEAGSYSSGLPAMPSRAWRRVVGRIRHLDELFQRVKRLEQALMQRKDMTNRSTE